MIQQIVFATLFFIGGTIFTLKILRLRKGLAIARPSNRNDQKAERWKIMTRVALGQGKMGTRPLAAFFHLIVYAGFVIINLSSMK